MIMFYKYASGTAKTEMRKCSFSKKEEHEIMGRTVRIKHDNKI